MNYLAASRRGIGSTNSRFAEAVRGKPRGIEPKTRLKFLISAFAEMGEKIFSIPVFMSKMCPV